MKRLGVNIDHVATVRNARGSSHPDPLSVAKYAMQRTPLAPAMPTFRADMEAGGARKDLALARFALGSTSMAVVASMAQQGQITGNGPANYDAKRILEMSGWKANSILLGDTYYSISRLDPVGNVLMMAANVTEIIGQQPLQFLLQIA